MPGVPFPLISPGKLPVSPYSLLPFRFLRLDADSVLLSNDTGEFCILSSESFADFAGKRLEPNSEDYLNLKSKHFLSDGRSSVHSRVLASKYWTKKSFLMGFTKLHIFVVSLRCDHSCPYCQVSRQSEDKFRFDMSLKTAHRAVDLMLRSPASNITCEFQGGEPLLNFPLIQEIVRYVKQQNAKIGKDISFVICTNLVPLTDEQLSFCHTHKVQISTSVDGPAFLHDLNRPFGRGSAHALVEHNIRRVQEALGPHALSALMTTTRESLKYPKEIVDEYIRLNLGSIFIRSLSPYGFATKTTKAIGYPMSDFVNFYKTALEYIVLINREGQTISEGFTTLLLTKMLTPYPIGYVDLQSPSGAGFGVVVYNYNGDVYASDESRMLAEMQETGFRLGNVHRQNYEEIFFGERMQTIAAASCNEALPGCSDCVWQPYCGADPVFHYATQGDMFGHRPTSGFCQKHMAIFRYLIDCLRQDDLELHKIFWAWIGERKISELNWPEVSCLSH